MTDKTPNKTAETPVNPQATLADTTNTARDSEPKSRALPQADALKARFKAGSIPLQTDFMDLIDLANMGRQAVGGAEGQIGPANGFTLSSEGLLELKPNTTKGIVVDKDGIAVKAEANKGLQITNNGVGVLAGQGITVANTGIAVKAEANKGLQVNGNGVGVLAGNGISVSNTGVAVKTETNKGLQVNGNGVGVLAGNGVAVNSSGVHLKLLNWADTTISGSAGGLTLGSTGLSAMAGQGITVANTGIAVKTESKKGLQVTSNGVGLNNEAWIKVMCELHNATFYAQHARFSVFFCNYSNGCVAYVYGRGGWYITAVNNNIKLGTTSADNLMVVMAPSSTHKATAMVYWNTKKAASGLKFECEVSPFVSGNITYIINADLVATP